MNSLGNANKRSDIALAILAGVMLVLGFQPFDLYLFPWVALVPLLIAIKGKSPRPSFLLGLLTGFTWFMGTIYWVFHWEYPGCNKRSYAFSAMPLSRKLCRPVLDVL
jgi:apolipoprotein N-acyltransferase